MAGGKHKGKSDGGSTNGQSSLNEESGSGCNVGNSAAVPLLSAVKNALYLKSQRSVIIKKETGEIMMKQTLKRSTVMALSFGLVFSFSSTVPALAKDTPPPPSFDSLKHLENFQFKQIQAWAPGHPQLNWQGGLGASRPPAPKPPSKPADWCKGYGVGITCEAAPPKPPEPDTSAFGDIMSMVELLAPLLGNLGSSPNPGQVAQQLNSLSFAAKNAPNIQEYIKSLEQKFKNLKLSSDLKDGDFTKALELLVNIYRLQASIKDNAFELTEPLKKLRDELSKYLEKKIDEKKKANKEVKESIKYIAKVDDILEDLVRLNYVDSSLLERQKEATKINKEIADLLQQLRAKDNLLQGRFWKDLEQLKDQIGSLKQLKPVSLDVPDTQNFNQIFSRKKRELHLPENLSFRQIAAEAQLVSAEGLEQSRKAVSDDFEKNIKSIEGSLSSKVSALVKKASDLLKEVDTSINSEIKVVKEEAKKRGRRSTPSPSPSVPAPPAPQARSADSQSSSQGSQQQKSEEDREKEKEIEDLARRVLNGEQFDNLKYKDEVWKRVTDWTSIIATLREEIRKYGDPTGLYQRQIDRIYGKKTRKVHREAVLQNLRFFRSISSEVAITETLQQKLDELQKNFEELKKKTKN